MGKNIFDYFEKETRLKPKLAILLWFLGKSFFDEKVT
jgi:hypothetical protein